MALSFYLSRNSSQAVRSYVEKSHSVLINQISFVLDRRIRDMENLVLQIGQNRKLDALSKVGTDMPEDFTFQLNQAVKYITTSLMQENNLARNYYIIFENSRYVISDSAQISLDLFFKYRFRYGNWERDDWLELFREYHKGTFLPADTFMNGNEEYRAIPFVKTIPFYFNSEGSAHVIFMIDEEDFKAYYTAETNVQCILLQLIDNRTGRELLTYDLPEGRRYINFSQRSALYDLTYAYLTPYEGVYQQFVTNRMILILANIATFLMGAFAAIYFSRSNADPLHSLYTKLPHYQSPEAGRNSPYVNLNRAVEEVMVSKASLEERLEEHKKVIGEEFYYRLVKYGFDSPDEMTALSSYLEKDLPRGMYGVILMNFYFETTAQTKAILEEFKKIKLTVMEIVRPVSRNPAYWMDLDNNSIGYIFSSDDPQDSDLWCTRAEEELQRLGALLDSHGIHVFWTVGNPVREPYNLNSSYLQARLILEESSDEARKGGIICYRSFQADRDQYNLPVELIQKLILLGKSGNYELAEELFLKNWEENIHSRQISSQMLKLYLSDLRGLINRLNPESMDIADYTHLPLDDPCLMKKRVLKALKEVSLRSLEDKKTVQEMLLALLNQYIDKYYDDPDLSLTVLSRKFNRSEGYLSHLFKQQGGENFSAILERKRLSKSMELSSRI